MLHERRGRKRARRPDPAPILIRYDSEIDAFALRSWSEAEVIHCQALRWTPVDAKRAADAGSFVDKHHRGLRTQFGPGHLGEFDVAVDRVNAIGRHHLDAFDRADVDAVRAENAAIAVDENIELALQAALGFFEANGLCVADLCFDRGVAGVETSIR